MFIQFFIVTKTMDIIHQTICVSDNTYKISKNHLSGDVRLEINKLFTTLKMQRVKKQRTEKKCAHTS